MLDKINKVDPIDILKIENGIYSDKNKKNRFSLQLMLFRACNFGCKYCITHSKPENINYDNLNLGFKNLDKFIKYHNDFFKEIETTQIQFMGGEPTLIDICEYLDKIQDNSFKEFRLMTNLFRPNKYFEDLQKYLFSRKIDIDITTSFHAGKITIEDFVDKMNCLISLFGDKSIRSHVIVNDETLPIVKKLEEKIGDNKNFHMMYRKDLTSRGKISNEVSDFINNKKKKNYTKGNTKITLKDGSEFLIGACDLRYVFGEKVFNPCGYFCETMSGKRVCKIDFANGNIMTCKASYTKESTIGNLFENNYKFDTCKNICTNQTCNFSNPGDIIWKV